MNLQENSSGKYTVCQCILYFFKDSTEQTVFAISMKRTTNIQQIKLCTLCGFRYIYRHQLTNKGYLMKSKQIHKIKRMKIILYHYQHRLVKKQSSHPQYLQTINSYLRPHADSLMINKLIRT